MEPEKDKGKEVFIGEKAAEEVFERHNEIHCIECRDSFVVEELSSRESWQCPHCEKQNPNLYYYFLLIGILLAMDIVANLIGLIYYMKTFGRDINILYVMWAAAHMLIAGYVLIAIYGDKHSYGLKPLRYLIPAVFASAVASAVVYQVPFSIVNVIVAGIVFVGTGGFIGYAFYLSLRMVTPHKAEESIVRPVYSTISIALNIMLLLIFTTVAVKFSKRTPGKSDVDFGEMGSPAPETAVTEEVREDLEEQLDEEIDITDPVINPDIFDKITPPEFIPIDTTVETDISIVKPREQVEQKQKKTRRMFPPKYQSRNRIEECLRIGGGTDQTEYAVLLALEWLKKHQNPDGSWGDGGVKPALTGLALLCFLGHGEDHLSEKYGEVVRAAIDWIVDQQDEQGYFADPHRGYQHGIVSYAIAEAYGLCQLEDLLPVVDKAIQRIIEGQTVAGGWVYRYAPDVNGRTMDMSVSGWQIQALKAAHSAGLRYSDHRLETAMAKSVGFLENSFSPTNETFGYNGRGAAWEQEYAMTATGTLCMEFLGKFNEKEVKSALSQMRKNYTISWKETEGGRSKLPLYSWYYVTQAFYQAGANPSTNVYWRFWNPQMQKTLLPRQNRDGSWPLPEKSNAMGSLGSKKNGEIWGTCFCCLMLEVYYRYLPTYRLVQ